MGDFFQVELETLATYVTTLKAAQEQLADLPNLLSGNGTDLGNDRLDEAAADFQVSWKRGAEQLGELVTETTDAVSEVHDGYAVTDQEISTVMRALQQPLDILGQA